MSRSVAVNYLLLVGVGLMWGSQFALNALAIESYPALTVAAGRIFLGFLTLAIVVAILPKEFVEIPARMKRQPWALYCAIALAEAIVPCFLIPWGQQYVDSAIAAILLATVPILTLIIAPFVVKSESWSVIAALSALVGFIGVVVLVAPTIKGNFFADIIGELAILGGALSFSLSLIMMGRLPDVPPVLAMRNIFLIAAGPLVVLAALLNEPWMIHPDSASVLSILALGIFCGGFAYVMFIVMVKRTGPIFTSLVGYLVTLVGVFIGIVFLREQLQVHDIVALSLIVTALIIAKYKPSSAPTGE